MPRPLTRAGSVPTLWIQAAGCLELPWGGGRFARAKAFKRLKLSLLPTPRPFKAIERRFWWRPDSFPTMKCIEV
jgi:hypothetical protein